MLPGVYLFMEQMTRSELAEKKLVVDEFKSTAPVIEKQGESLLQIGQQLNAVVHGLHSKLERQESLHKSNEDLVQDKLQEFNGQFKQLQQQLQTYRTAFAQTSDSLKTQLASFVVAKNEDMKSTGQVVSDMGNCISSAATAVEKKSKAHAKASDKISAAMTKVVTKQSESAAAAASEAASAVAYAGESIQAAVETQQAAVTDMQSAVAAHVNVFQELAASFVEQQAAIVLRLQESVTQHMQALEQQQIDQQKQIDDLQQQHAAATLDAKARVMEALSLALDAGFAKQTNAVSSVATAMQATLAKSQEASSAAAVSISATAALSAEAGATYIKACVPVANAFNSAAACLHEKNGEAVSIITSSSKSAAVSAASAHKSVAAATAKLTESVASAVAEASAANEKFANDIESRLKESPPVFRISLCKHCCPLLTPISGGDRRRRCFGGRMLEDRCGCARGNDGDERGDGGAGSS